MNTAEFIPDSARKVISAFLAQGDELGVGGDDDGLDVSAPQANAYEFQSQAASRSLARRRAWGASSQ